MRAQLVVDVLEMALDRRRPSPELNRHSDQGSQGGFTRSSQDLVLRSRDRQAGWWMNGLTGRSVMESPGKSSHRREVERWFWREIAKGLSSEDAAPAVGVSQAARSRWREEIALPRAEGKGVRAIARENGRAPSTILRELRRNAATRGGMLEYAHRWRSERPSWWPVAQDGQGGR